MLSARNISDFRFFLDFGIFADYLLSSPKLKIQKDKILPNSELFEGLVSAQRILEYFEFVNYRCTADICRYSYKNQKC